MTRTLFCRHPAQLTAVNLPWPKIHNLLNIPMLVALPDATAYGFCSLAGLILCVFEHSV